MKGFAALLGAVLAALGLAARAADPPPGCKLARIVEWPVQFRGGVPVIEGAINGKKIGVLLDTGAFASVLTKAAADRLGVYTRATSEYMYGMGGETRLFVAMLDELRVGNMVRKDIRVRVGGERDLRGIDFVLGDDFFKELEIEFDYAKGVIRVFRAHECKGVSLSYWDRNAHQVPLEDNERLFVDVKVNGRPARALLDSGASNSVVALSFASKLGITPRTPGVVPSGCTAGFGADIVRNWVARLDSVEIGNQVTRDPQLHISDDALEPMWITRTQQDMILGADFLRAHRVLVSRSQHKVYFSYIGGKVFSATPSTECDERMAGKPVDEALAIYDADLAKNPADARALLQRALIRMRANDAKAALPDLDAVIRLDPGNAPALAWRSSARLTLKDPAGALADSDAAIARGMRTAQMYVIRAEARQDQGDHAGAMAEYGEALKVDPRYPPALRARGRHHFHDGRFEAAENDLAAALTRRADPFDSIWLSMARARRGLDGKAGLEQALSRVKEGEWPAPVLQFLAGRIDREALLDAAARGEEAKKKGQVCEARFYIAESLIAAGKRSAARPFLEQARDECPRDYIEYQAAVVELARPQ